jgi:hypothetical protein
MQFASSLTVQVERSEARLRGWRNASLLSGNVVVELQLELSGLLTTIPALPSNEVGHSRL